MDAHSITTELVADVPQTAGWTGAVRVAGRVLFAAIVLTTATAAGALFVAWPTQPESRSSIHIIVGGHLAAAATGNDETAVDVSYAGALAP